MTQNKNSLGDEHVYGLLHLASRRLANYRQLGAASQTGFSRIKLTHTEAYEQFSFSNPVPDAFGFSVDGEDRCSAYNRLAVSHVGG